MQKVTPCEEERPRLQGCGDLLGTFGQIVTTARAVPVVSLDSFSRRDLQPRIHSSLICDGRLSLKFRGR